VSSRLDSLVRLRESHDSRGRVLALCCLSLLFVFGCNFPGKPNPADQPVLPSKILDFSTLFQQNCAGCHGAKGELGPAPPLNSPLFRSLVPASELEQVIANGRAGTPMPAFALSSGGTLTAVQVKLLVYEIKGIRYKKAEQPEPAAVQIEVIPDPSGSAPSWGAPEPAPADAPSYLVEKSKVPVGGDAAERIRTTVFARACANCHGERGQGTAMTGAINVPAFLRLASDQFLRRAIITGRADLGMPDFAAAKGRGPDFKPLTSQEVTDLVELLGYWRQGSAAAGAVEQQTPATTTSVGAPVRRADQHAKSS
jgi:cytochrome c oxidase cbb3-type subunit III